ncbi:MAG: glycoside hydrolase family 127 protein, partial [Bacteroidaceae bacterium]|nr:glycoside hydrolase family 127 protein [Bacteroidaceae bacterium]
APFSNPEAYNDYYTYDYNIPVEMNMTMQVNKGKPLIKRKDNTLDFVTNDGQILRPLYDIHHKRYAAYWNLETVNNK